MASEAVEKLIQQIKNEAARDLLRNPEQYSLTMFGMPVGHVAGLRAFFERHTGIQPIDLANMQVSEIVDAKVIR